MGGGKGRETVDLQLKDAPEVGPENAETQGVSSTLFSRRFASSLWHKQPLQVTPQVTPRKRATLTPDDFLAHAFGLDFAVSASQKGGSETGFSTPSESPGTPVWDSSSLSRRVKSKSRKSKPSERVLPKIPPRGTFSSARTCKKPKELPLPSPPSSEPPSPVLPLNDLDASGNEDVASPSLYAQDGPERELPMTPEEWKENSEQRMQRRRLRKLAFAIDVDCSCDQLPLDIDCRPVGWSMGLGLAPISEDHFERHRRARSSDRSSLDAFWPTCDTASHVDEEQFSSVPATPESSTIDIEELTDRYAAMSSSIPPHK